MCRYNWHSSGSLEAILSNSTRKLLWFEITKNADCRFKSTFIVLFCDNFRRAFVPHWRRRHRAEVMKSQRVCQSVPKRLGTTRRRAGRRRQLVGPPLNRDFAPRSSDVTHSRAARVSVSRDLVTSHPMGRRRRLRRN